MSRASSKAPIRSAADSAAPHPSSIITTTLTGAGGSSASSAEASDSVSTSLGSASLGDAPISRSAPEGSAVSASAAGGAGSGAAASAIGSEPEVISSSLASKDPVMAKLQKRYKVIEKKDVDYLNAFNAMGYSKYWYRHDDIARIGDSLIKGFNKEDVVARVDVVFAPPQGIDGSYGINEVARELGKFRVDLEAGKKVVGTFNTGGNHWIAYALEKYVVGGIGESVPRDSVDEGARTDADGGISAAAGGGGRAGGTKAKSRGAADAALEMSSEAAESTRGAEVLGSRSGDGSKIVCVYKDSYGRKRADFEKIVKKAFGGSAFGVDRGVSDTVDVRILDEGRKDQEDKVSCGIFALKNMEALAKHSGNPLGAGGGERAEGYARSLGSVSSVESVSSLEFCRARGEELKDLRREYGEIYSSSVIDERIEDILSGKWLDLHREFEISLAGSIKDSLSDDLKTKIDRNEISIGFRGNRDIDEGFELRVELGNLDKEERKAIKTSLKKVLKRGSTDIAIEERFEGGSLAKYVVKVNNLKNSKDTPVSRLSEQRWSESSSLSLSPEEVKESAKALVKELKPIRIEELKIMEDKLASNGKFESVRGKLLQNKDGEKTYIHEAAEGGDAEFLEALLNAGTSPNLSYKEGGDERIMLEEVCKVLLEIRLEDGAAVGTATHSASAGGGGGIRSAAADDAGGSTVGGSGGATGSVVRESSIIHKKMVELEKGIVLLVDSGAKTGALKDLKHKEKVAELTARKAINVSSREIGEVRREVVDVKRELKEFISKVPEVTLEMWEKENVASGRMREAAREVVEYIYGDSAGDLNIELCESILTSFSKYMQSQLRIAITGVSAAASGKVSIELDKSEVVFNALKLIPVVGSLVSEALKTSLDNAQKKQALIWMVEQASHMVSGSHQDIVIKEFTSHVVKYMGVEIVQSGLYGFLSSSSITRNPELYGRIKTKLKSVLKDKKTDFEIEQEILMGRIGSLFKLLLVDLQSRDLIKIVTNDLLLGKSFENYLFDKRDERGGISDKWKEVAGKGVLDFLGYLLNNRLDYGRSDYLGEAIARGVLPAWAFDDDIGAKGRWKEILRKKVEGYDIEKSMLMAELSSLVYKDNNEIERVLKQKWGCEDFKIVGRGSHLAQDLKALMINGEEEMVVVIRGTVFDSAKNWISRNLNFPTIRIGIDTGKLGGVKSSLDVHKGFWGAVMELWEMEGGIGSLMSLENLLVDKEVRVIADISSRGGATGEAGSGGGVLSEAAGGAGGGAAGGGGRLLEERRERGDGSSDVTKVPKKLFCAGHSLGGAGAHGITVKMVDWINNKLSEESLTRDTRDKLIKELELHTFGQPKFLKGVESISVWEDLGVKFYRVINEKDLVTMVPPSKGLGGEHVGQEYWIGGVCGRGLSHEDLIRDVTTAKRLITKDARRKLAEYDLDLGEWIKKAAKDALKNIGKLFTTPEAGKWLAGMFQVISAHDIENYYKRLNAVKILGAEFRLIDDIEDREYSDGRFARIVGVEAGSDKQDKKPGTGGKIALGGAADAALRLTSESGKYTKTEKAEKLLTKENIKKSKTGLDEAAEAGNIEIVRSLIDEDKITPNWYTLDRAAKSGNLELVRCIIDEHKIKPNLQTLNMSARSGNIELMRYLIDEHKITLDSYTLRYAAESVNIDMVRCIIDEHKIKPDSKTLSYAVSNGNIEIVRRLIDAGAKPDSNTLSYAVSHGNIEIVLEVIDAGAKPDSQTLSYAVSNGNIEIVVRAVIDAGAKPNEHTLSRAIEKGNMDIVRAVIDAGAKPDSNTLNYAAESGNIEIVHSVIELGAKPDSKTLSKAVESGNIEIVRSVIELDAKPNEYTLSSAIRRGNMDIVRAVIDASAKPDSETLSYAARSGNLEVVRRVIELGAKPDLETLSYAARSGNLEIVSSVIELDAKPVSSTLSYAARSGNMKLVRWFIDEHKLKPVSSTLSEAADSGNLELVLWLINECKIKPNTGTLTRATMSGNLELVRWLINECKIKPDSDTLTYAALYRKREIVEYLQNDFDINHLNSQKTFLNFHYAVHRRDVGSVKLLDNSISGVPSSFHLATAFPDNKNIFEYLLYEAKKTVPIDYKFFRDVLGREYSTEDYLKLARYIKHIDTTYIHELRKTLSDTKGWKKFLLALQNELYLRNAIAKTEALEEAEVELKTGVVRLGLDKFSVDSSQLYLMQDIDELKYEIKHKLLYFPFNLELIEEVDSAYELLDAEMLIPAAGFGTIVSWAVKPSVRWHSAKSANKVINKDSPLFVRIKELQAKIESERQKLYTDLKAKLSASFKDSANLEVVKLKKVGDLDEFKYIHLFQGDLAEEIIDLGLTDIELSRILSASEREGSSLRDDAAQIINIIEKLWVLTRLDKYYETYVDRFIEKYGDSYKHSDKFRMAGAAAGSFDEDKYIREIARITENAELIDNVDEIELIEGKKVRKVLPSDMVIVRVPVEALREEDIAALPRGVAYGAYVLDKATGLSIEMPESSSGFGKHVVVSHEGVHYKYWPYAPGIEFAVNSFNRVILDSITLPSTLIKLVGVGSLNLGMEAIYQASRTIAGENLYHIIKEKPEYVRLIDQKNYTGMFLSTLLMGAGDAKPDNFMVRRGRDDSKEEGFRINLMGIDSDIGFCRGNLGFRKIEQRDGRVISKIRAEMANILFFMPQMDQPLDRSVVLEFTSKVGKTEELISSWLSSLHKKNQEYKKMIEGGFLSNDNVRFLKLPIKLPEQTALDIYTRMKSTIKLLKYNGAATANDVLQELFPALALYYGMIREHSSGDAGRAIERVYSDSADDRAQAAKMISDSEGDKKTISRTLSTFKMHDHTEFAKKFNKSPEELASEFLSAIDFRELRDVSELSLNVLGANLMYVKDMRLKNINLRQMEHFLNGLVQKNASGGYQKKPGCLLEEIILIKTDASSGDEDLLQSEDLAHLSLSNILRACRISVENGRESPEVEDSIDMVERERADVGEGADATGLRSFEEATNYFLRLMEISSNDDIKREEAREFITKLNKLRKWVSSLDEASKVLLREKLMSEQVERVDDYSESGEIGMGSAAAPAAAGGAGSGGGAAGWSDRDRAGGGRDGASDRSESSGSAPVVREIEERSYFENLWIKMFERKQLSKFVSEIVKIGVVRKEDIVREIEFRNESGEITSKSLNLFVKVIEHPKWWVYGGLISSVAEKMPEILNEGISGRKICDMVWGKFRKDGKGEGIVADIINRGGEWRASTEEEELMQYGRSKGILVSEAEIREGKYDHRKINIKEGEEKTILHYMIDDLNGYGGYLFDYAFKGYEENVEYNQENMKKLFDYTADVRREERDVDIIEKLYSKVRDKTAIVLFDEHGKPKYMKFGERGSMEWMQNHAAWMKNKLGFTVSLQEMIEGKVDLNDVDGYGNTILMRSILAEDAAFGHSKAEEVRFIVENAKALGVSLTRTKRIDGRDVLDLVREREGDDAALTILIKEAVEDALESGSDGYSSDADSEAGFEQFADYETLGERLRFAFRSGAAAASDDDHSSAVRLGLMADDEEVAVIGDTRPVVWRGGAEECKNPD